MKAAAIVIIAIVMAISAIGQDLRRTSPTRRSTARRQPVTAIVTDTIATPPADSVSISGYDKPLRSLRESMFITNHTAHPVLTVGLDIVYTATDGAMLHRATREVSVNIPAGETRRCEIPSFDRAGRFYLHGTPPPRSAAATPFKASVTITYITRPCPADTLSAVGGLTPNTTAQ